MKDAASGGRVSAIALIVLLGTCIGCGDGGGNGAPATEAQYETTRLCALVPARDPAAAAFPPTPPVRTFGTDLGWTYEFNGVVTMLFGDSWQRIDICPLQLNDDCLATMQVPGHDWPGYTARASIPDAQCPELKFAIDAAGTAFAPIELHRWDGEIVPLGPLNTPVFGFQDGQREWAVFIVGGGQLCSQHENDAAACPTELSPQAADLRCAVINGQNLCADPTSTKSSAGTQAYYLHIAERVGPTSYVSRAMFLTNKYLNLTARAVRSFDPHDARRRDYEPGTSALLMWGRPGFDDQSRDGEAPPYFAYHELPFQIADEQIVFRPHYFRGLENGSPVFSASQTDAVPLYSDEFEPVNHAAVSYLSPLSRWLMIYGGGVVDFSDRNGIAGESQPVKGALYVRSAPDPWGPWSDAEPVLTEEQVAQDMVCGKHAPTGCLPPPNPLIRPACLEAVDPLGGGALYGANIIDTMTRRVSARSGRGPAADVFWNLSTWHPYSVVLVRTHVELH